MKTLLAALLWSLTLSAATVEVATYDHVKEVIGHSSRYSVVVLGTDHCPFCKITMEAIRKLDPKYDVKAQFMYVNLDQNEEARIDYNVFATPNVLFFGPEGTLIEQKIGGLNEIGFAKKLDAFK